jgi:hypothetical protein
MTVYVRADDLKELVAKWRRASDSVYSDSAKMSNVYEDVADELEAIYQA